jgi:predicted enzyme related to lactoylglutathione lyase
VTVRWLTTFLDRPAPTFDATVAFWTAVTGTMLSEARGEHGEFTTLLPRDGDAYLRMQRVAAGPGGSHFDLHTDDINALADRAEHLGASVERRLDDVVVLRSPAGLPFCSVRHVGETTPPAPPRVDQVCIDVPPDEYERECAFWSAITGWEHRPAMLQEYSYLDAPEPIATRVLFQRLGEGTVGAHLDIACADVEASTTEHERLGATVVAHHEWWTTLLDPAGLPYCLIRRPT